MKWTSLNELREQYLSFFESKGHLRHESFPLVPINDKSLLLINAGMAPLKKYFTGEAEPPRHRMTTCQKCIRTPDIERVGITARHGTFFEMLGNFSFGDYFKEEAITWAWEFITQVLELPRERLWVTIYTDDDEAYGIWHDKVGVAAERIVRLGKDDNFWEIGSGPCGPCSEIHFDRGPEYGCGRPDCKPGCDCDRFMEFWNLVFTQFDGDGNGGYTPLAHPNIDTGMGLERLACLMQGVNNLFETDTIRNIMASISEKAGVKYGAGEKSDISLRVITDHIRSTMFLVCDGVVPSNEGRGYVLRRLLRRAARHGRLLGIKGTFLSDICAVVAHENTTAYPELTEKLSYIQKVVRIEEERFAATIDAGLDKLSALLDATAPGGVLNGADVFRLSDTFGFSVDLTREIAAERGITVDEEGYALLLSEQKDRARAARMSLGDLGWTGESFEYLEGLAETEFTGYTETSSDAALLAIINSDGEAVGQATPESGCVTLVLDRTPFYGEGGGQVGDTGIISAPDTRVEVTDTKKHNGRYMHVCHVAEGVLRVGDAVTAAINTERRDAIRRNHSAAHLLQAALRRVLGNHVGQAGSYVDDQRLRFDFTHFTAVTPEELAAVEAEVNGEIFAADPINTFETDIETAKTMGAMALFGEKYGKVVRLVKMGGYSSELCGGTHLDNTARAGLFKIVSESSVAAGIRRIEAVTGAGVLGLLDERDRLIADTAHELKAANSGDIARRSSQLTAEIKALRSELDTLGARLASAQTAGLLASALRIGGIRAIFHTFRDEAPELPRRICDEFKANHADCVTVIAAINNSRLTFTCSCGAEAVAAGADASKILKKLCAITGGGGGGRPDSASAGGRDVTRLAEAEAQFASIVESLL